MTLSSICANFCAMSTCGASVLISMTSRPRLSAQFAISVASSQDIDVCKHQGACTNLRVSDRRVGLGQKGYDVARHGGDETGLGLVGILPRHHFDMVSGLESLPDTPRWHLDLCPLGSNAPTGCVVRVSRLIELTVLCSHSNPSTWSPGCSTAIAAFRAALAIRERSRRGQMEL